jgi:hypothetical protein
MNKTSRLLREDTTGIVLSRGPDSRIAPGHANKQAKLTTINSFQYASCYILPSTETSSPSILRPRHSGAPYLSQPRS